MVLVGSSVASGRLAFRPSERWERMDEMTALPFLKRVADGLTLVRVLLALVMLWVGLSLGRAALDTAAILLILAWATDLLDGPLARRAHCDRQTWIGDHDLEVDVALSLGLLAYLILGGYVAPLIGAGYVVICGFLLWWSRSRHLAMAVQAPVYLILIYSALRYAFPYGWIVIGWILMSVLVTWPRFPKVIVPEFIEGMRQLRR
jgi:cardiolipin synthase